MSDQPAQKTEGISFLGLTIAYPTTFWGMMPYFFVCSAVVAIFYLTSRHQTPEPRRLWLPAVVDTNGGQLVMGETEQMNFWTPSVRTKDYLGKITDPATDPDSWQVLSNDNPLITFGMMLHTNSDVLGYRRTEVWGHGRSMFKPGWWWTVNVHTNFTVTDMAQAYHSFWKGSGPVFIEVVKNRGSD
jgi:hypothetical protein